MFILLITLLVLATGIGLAVLIPKDGYGARPIPRSHLDPFPPRHLV